MKEKKETITMKKIKEEFFIRVFLGIILLILSVFSLYFGGLFLFFTACCFSTLIIYEYKLMFNQANINLNLFLMCCFSYLIFSFFLFQNSTEIIKSLFIIFVFLTFINTLIKQQKPFMSEIAGTVISYIFVLSLSYILSVRYIYGLSGFYILMFYFGIILVTDYTASVFGGKFGKNKLIPVVSPNKTVFGSVSGIICAVIYSLFCIPFVKLPWYIIIILSFYISVFAQISDLSISLIKRDLGIKHSSLFFHEYGGAIDRVDSFIFSAPALFLFLNITDKFITI